MNSSTAPARHEEAQPARPGQNGFPNLPPGQPQQRVYASARARKVMARVQKYRADKAQRFPTREFRPRPRQSFTDEEDQENVQDGPELLDSSHFRHRQPSQKYCQLDQQPVYDHQLVYDDQQPGYDDQQLVYDDQQPGYDDQQPGYDDQQLVYDDQQPVYDDQQPVYDHQPIHEHQPIHDQHNHQHVSYPPESSSGHLPPPTHPHPPNLVPNYPPGHYHSYLQPQVYEYETTNQPSFQSQQQPIYPPTTPAEYNKSCEPQGYYSPPQHLLPNQSVSSSHEIQHTEYHSSYYPAELGKEHPQAFQNRSPEHSAQEPYPSHPVGDQQLNEPQLVPNYPPPPVYHTFHHLTRSTSSVHGFEAAHSDSSHTATPLPLQQPQPVQVKIESIPQQYPSHLENEQLWITDEAPHAEHDTFLSGPYQREQTRAYPPTDQPPSQPHYHPHHIIGHQIPSHHPTPVPKNSLEHDSPWYPSSRDDDANEQEARQILVNLISWGVPADYLLGIGISESLVCKMYPKSHPGADQGSFLAKQEDVMAKENRQLSCPPAHIVHTYHKPPSAPAYKPLKLQPPENAPKAPRKQSAQPPENAPKGPRKHTPAIDEHRPFGSASYTSKHTKHEYHNQPSSASWPAPMCKPDTVEAQHLVERPKSSPTKLNQVPPAQPSTSHWPTAVRKTGPPVETQKPAEKPKLSPSTLHSAAPSRPLYYEDLIKGALESRATSSKKTATSPAKKSDSSAALSKQKTSEAPKKPTSASSDPVIVLPLKKTILTGAELMANELARLAKKAELGVEGPGKTWEGAAAGQKTDIRVAKADGQGDQEQDHVGSTSDAIAKTKVPTDPILVWLKSTGVDLTKKLSPAPGPSTPTHSDTAVGPAKNPAAGVTLLKKRGTVAALAKKSKTVVKEKVPSGPTVERLKTAGASVDLGKKRNPGAGPSRASEAPEKGPAGPMKTGDEPTKKPAGLKAPKKPEQVAEAPSGVKCAGGAGEPQDTKKRAAEAAKIGTAGAKKKRGKKVGAELPKVELRRSLRTRAASTSQESAQLALVRPDVPPPNP